MGSPQRFLGNSLLQWTNLAAAAIPWHVELMFRTRQASATLLHVASGLQHNLTLQVRATRLTCERHDGSAQPKTWWESGSTCWPPETQHISDVRQPDCSSAHSDVFFFPCSYYETFHLPPAVSAL